MERALARSRDRQEAPRSSRRIRLMIVDDSMIARAVLSRMVESDDAFEIVAVAGTAEDAVEALREVNVDIILLDLEMPGAGGLKSIPRITAAAAGARVMIVSSLAEEGAEETVAALALGAADTMPKPGTGRFNGRFSEILLGKLKALGFAERPDRPGIRPASLPACFAQCRQTRSRCSQSAPRPAASTRSAPCSRICRGASAFRSL
jgi:two-component system chemotaxis response regulator CheB